MLSVYIRKEHQALPHVRKKEWDCKNPAIASEKNQDQSEKIGFVSKSKKILQIREKRNQYKAKKHAQL